MRTLKAEISFKDYMSANQSDLKSGIRSILVKAGLETNSNGSLIGDVSYSEDHEGNKIIVTQVISQ